MSSSIEWTDYTWNPTVGCSRVSPGCDHCYAETVATRGMHPSHRAAIDGGKWTGDVVLVPERLTAPKLPAGKRVFVGSMSDLFHQSVPDDYIARVFAAMDAARHLTFQVLTKRPQRMARLLGSTAFRMLVDDHRGGAAGDFVWPLPHVWIGTSVEDQRYADLRVPFLLATPAAVRFLSVEPLLGPVDLLGAVEPDWVGSSAGGSGAPHPLVDWVIVGGESGSGARPMHPQWVRDLRDQCVGAGVPFFFKQAGTVLAREWGCADRKGGQLEEWPDDLQIREMPR